MLRDRSEASKRGDDPGVVTIGFAAASLGNAEAGFLIAADSRYSATDGASLDMAIKTYSLGPRTGAVAAGNALSVNIAAELARGIADDHETLSPAIPVSFYNSVRLFSFFLDKVERSNPWSRGSEVVVAGFLANGSPALAKDTRGVTEGYGERLFSRESLQRGTEASTALPPGGVQSGVHYCAAVAASCSHGGLPAVYYPPDADPAIQVD